MVFELDNITTNQGSELDLDLLSNIEYLKSFEVTEIEDNNYIWMPFDYLNLEF